MSDCLLCGRPIRPGQMVLSVGQQQTTDGGAVLTTRQVGVVHFDHLKAVV